MGIISRTSWYKRLSSNGVTVTWSQFQIGWSIDFDGMRLIHLGPMTLYDLSETIPLVNDMSADSILLWMSRSMFHKVDLQVWPGEFKVGFSKGDHHFTIDLGFLSFVYHVTVDIAERPTWSFTNPPLFGWWSLF